ncbi:MAG: hypothetical protein GWP63_23980 [Haliea sp.]|jgi:hypothetical protein|nr:hypothetical protein [Haliea sp.]
MTNLALPSVPSFDDNVEILGRLLKLIAEFDRRKGWCSDITVRAMTQAATPENEDYLLYIAHYGTASHVEQVDDSRRGGAGRGTGESCGRK